MDDGRRPRVEEEQPLEDLPAPRLEDAVGDLLEAAEVGLEGARGHELGDEDDVLLRHAGGLHHLPGVVEADNVRVLHPLQHVRLFSEPLALGLAQLLLLKIEGMFYKNGRS